MVINYSKEVPNLLLEQIIAYATKHKINVIFSKWDSVQMAFDRLAYSVNHLTESELYNEIINIEEIK